MGKVQLSMGHADKAIESFRQAMTIMDKPPELGEATFLHNMTHFFRARVWALRSSVVGQGKTKLTEAEQAERSRVCRSRHGGPQEDRRRVHLSRDAQV